MRVVLGTPQTAERAERDTGRSDEPLERPPLRGSRFGPRTYSVRLSTVFDDRDDGEAHACFGKARLVVWTEQIGGTTPRRVMRSLSLQILPPRA